MNKAFKYKFLQLASNTFIFWAFMGMLGLFNFQALINSGGLASGGEGFNNGVKYQLLANNYLFVISFFGLIFAVILGSRIAGKDIYSGHLGIVLCSYPSRARYYLASLTSAAFFMFLAMAIVAVNLLILLGVFNIDYPRFEILSAFGSQYLNGLVLLTVSGLFSVAAPSAAIYLGLAGYAYFNLYTYNELPFIKIPLIFNVSQFMDFLCLLFPIRDVMMPSYTPAAVIETYSINPLGLPAALYQSAFIVLVTGIGMFLFVRKDL